MPVAVMLQPDPSQKLASIQEDMEKVDLLNEAAYSFRYSNPGQTFELGAQAFELAKKIDYRLGMAAALRMRGIGNIILCDYVQSLADLQQAWSLYTELDDLQGLGNVSSNLGLIYQRMSQFDLALEWLYRSLKLSEEQGDDVITSNNLGNIATVYVKLKQYEKALQYNERTMEIKQALGDRYGVALSLSAIGDIYEQIGDYDTANDFQQKALEFARASGEIIAVSSVLRSLGRIQQHLKQYGGAMQSFLQALEALEEVGDKQSKGELYIELSHLHRERGVYGEALAYARRALEISQELGNREKEFEAHLAISKAYESLEDYKNALAHHKQYHAIESEALNVSASMKIAGLQVRLDFEKSEREKELIRLRNIELDGALNDIKLKAALIEEKNKDITGSINYARRIQQALLPQMDDVANALPNSFIFYKPKDIVCGDFFWVCQSGNITLAAAVDCTGHGVPAALMSIIGYNLLNDIVVNKGITEPSKILSHLHNGVRTALKQDSDESHINLDGMDIALCAFDRLKKEVQFAGAFSSLYIASRNMVEEIKGDKYPIGGIQEEVFRIYTNHRIALQGNETFYLCSDGFANQVGAQTNKRYTTKRLKEFIETLRAVPLQDQKSYFEKEFKNWSAGYEQMDDILVFGIRP